MRDYDGSLESLGRWLNDYGKQVLADRAPVIVRAVLMLLPACYAEGERRPDPDAAFSCGLGAVQVIDDLQLALAPGWKPEGYNGHLWVHTDTLPDSADFKDDHNIEKEGVERAVGEYLKRPWLTSGYLDWVLVDALTRNEVVAFEYHVHQARNPFTIWKKSRLEKWLIDRGVLGWLTEAVTLAAVVWWLWPEYAEEAPHRGLWAIAAMLYYGFVGLRFLTGLKKVKAANAKSAEARATIDHLMATMRLCYREFRGPVLDPTRVREAFKAAEKLGTGWSTVLWPLMENAIRRDPAIWVTEQP